MVSFLKKIYIFLATLFLGLVFLFLVTKFIGWQEIKKNFLIFKGWQGFFILFLTFLMAVLAILKWQEILKAQKIKISFWQLVLPYLSGYFLIFVVPTIFWGGETLRTYLLKKRENISFADSSLSVILERILEWTVNIFLVLFGIIIFFLKTKTNFSFWGLLLFLLFLFFGGGMGYFYLKAFKRESIIRSFLGERLKNPQNIFLEIEKEMLELLRFKKKAMKKALFYTFLRAFLAYLRFLFLIFFFTKKFFPLATISILGFFYFAGMFPIPTALGIQEVFQSFVFQKLMIKTSIAPSLVMITRGAELFLALLGMILLLKFGMGVLKNIFIDSNNYDKQ